MLTTFYFVSFALRRNPDKFSTTQLLTQYTERLLIPLSLVVSFCSAIQRESQAT